MHCGSVRNSIGAGLIRIHGILYYWFVTH
jgi:hypothetical protein